MRKNILHAMGGEQTGEFLNLPVIPEQGRVLPIALNPQIITKPAMLDPDTVGPEVVSSFFRGARWGDGRPGKARCCARQSRLHIIVHCRVLQPRRLQPDNVV